MTIDCTDATLVEQCLAGEKDAFGELLKRHQDRVFALALRITAERESAADLAQETFIRAYRKLATFNPRYGFGNWLLSICANLGRNRYRSETRRHSAQQAHLDLYPRGASPPDPRQAALDEALQQMPDRLRLPLVLKHSQGLSYEEVAQVLKIGVSAAKMRVKRARDDLVRLLCPPGKGMVP